MKRILKGLLSFVLMLTCITPVVSEQVNAAEKEIDNEYVQPIDWENRFNREIIEDELMLKVKQTFKNSTKYALGGWFKDRRKFNDPLVNVGPYYNLKQAAAYDGDGGYIPDGFEAYPEHVYREPACQAYGIAISIRTNVYDEDFVGVSKEDAIKTAIKLATSVAHEHKSNTGLDNEPQFKRWGDDWQAAHWAYYAGYAGWLLWDYMDDHQQNLIRNMVEHEANRFNNIVPEFWLSRDGIDIRGGDTAQEELAWNAELINLAIHMMPKHENVDIWKGRWTEYQLSSFASPQMNESEEMIHGKKAKEWVYGSNINENGILKNHGFIHPSYNASATSVNVSNINNLVEDTLPYAAKHNLDLVYKGLSEYKFSTTQYPKPGGSMYQEDGTIYYPQGSDWGTELYDVYVNKDISAMVYGYADSNVAHDWALKHVNKLIEQQSRFSDGRTYERPGIDGCDKTNDFSYQGNEGALSSKMGNAYMTLWLQQKIGIKFTNEPLEYYPWKEANYEENEVLHYANEATFVRKGSGYADKNFSPAKSLEVRKSNTVENRNLDTYLKFNTDTVDENPLSATLYLNVEYKGEESTVAKHKAELIDSTAWNEKTITYNTKPESTGTIIAEWDVNTTGEMVKVDVTKYVKEAIKEGKGFSIRIYTEEDSGNNNVKYTGKFGRFAPCLGLSYDENMVSKVSLKKLIRTAKTYTQDGYSQGSWSDFKAALTYAEEIAQKETATKEEVSNAETKLQTAIDSLKEVLLIRTPIINAKSAEDGSHYSEGTVGTKIIDHSGMSGKTSLKDVHDNNVSALTMWHTDKNPGANAWVKVDLGDLYALDEMWIWNMNQKDRNGNDKSTRGLKNVKIEYSKDGESWDELQPEEGMTFTDGVEGYPFQFARATSEANLPATNLNDGKNSPVSFDGAEARYVKITAHPEAGKGSWGDIYFGLSEVRFTHKTVDKTQLADLYNEYIDIKQGNYTDASWNDFQEALENAKDVFEDAKATEEDIANAIETLENAKEALEVKKADYSKVNEAIAKATAIDRNKYTEESLATLDEAINTVVEGLDITKQKEVDAMAKAIEDALAGLVESIPWTDLEPSKPIVPTTPLEPSTPVDKGDKEEGTDTGDTSNKAAMAGLMLLAGAVIVLRRRKAVK